MQKVIIIYLDRFVCPCEGGEGVNTVGSVAGELKWLVRGAGPLEGCQRSLGWVGR